MAGTHAFGLFEFSTKGSLSEYFKKSARSSLLRFAVCLHDDLCAAYIWTNGKVETIRTERWRFSAIRFALYIR